ncbi:hypothetical protein I545_3014 [Mycobacterium kansasii 662]|uniref:Uncharacterized protein n=2 Tax=Mycobacterium kansasii TaxID=1768 RepID=A0A1V3WCP2_MYCKA|nr:hypothetical protein I545_3014 [Mycobacterium kansasii 662]KEP41360.1 hypothetical protein MKSMC1_35140 [Mycobacterium kansasii]OOK64690.1 hypothetical protein BZL29_8003 [Mycobacterium kansasii]OOK74001.1 hypothetical protein BZL30_4342 [Mycobacterium kansasii]
MKLSRTESPDFRLVAELGLPHAAVAESSGRPCDDASVG